MATNVKDTIRATMMGAIPTSIGASGHLLIYTGSAPTKTSAPTGTLLATLALSSTAGTVSGGVLTFNAITSAAAGNSGTPGYYRTIDGATDDGTHTQLQGSCAVSGGDISFPSTISAGGTTGVSALSYTEGNA